MNTELHLLIDGRLVPGAQTLDVINPATGTTFIAVSRADETQALRAIAAAKKAFPAWAALRTPLRRSLKL
ncbi:MAG TPA: aldehyde dehydrogenase family protein [Telluria sp.]